MKELSIFVDESGNFGEYQSHDRYYLITLVTHDQSINIDNQIGLLNSELKNLGLYNHCVHSGPIIRKQEDYELMTVSERRRVLNKMMAFIRSIDISYECVYIEKIQVDDSVEAAGKLGKQIADFIKIHYSTFLEYDVVKVYYDNGQIEVTKILSTIFNALLNNVEFRKVRPSDYKLFQVADVFCTFELLKLKIKDRGLSKSEKLFFGNMKSLQKNYLKVIKNKRWSEK